jgi:outer membrane protein assembly factor BamB
MVGLSVSRGLIVEASTGSIHCVRARDGKILWSRDLGFGGRFWPHAPVIDGDTIYTQLTAGGTQVVALGLRDGRWRWRHSFPWGVDFEAGMDVHRVGPMAAAGGVILGVVPTGPQESASPALMCWQAATGSLLWRQSVWWTNLPLVVSGGVVCLIGDDHVIHGYSLREGHSLWTRPIDPSELFGPWVAWRREILSGLFLREHAYLAGIDPHRGAVSWRVPLPESEWVDRVQPLGDSGTLLVTAWWSGVYRLYEISAPMRQGPQQPRQSNFPRRSTSALRLPHAASGPR